MVQYQRGQNAPRQFHGQTWIVTTRAHKAQHRESERAHGAQLGPGDALDYLVPVIEDLSD